MSFFDFLFNSKELASSTAFRLNCFKDFSFDLVKSSVCKTITLFKLSTIIFKQGSYFKDLFYFIKKMNLCFSIKGVLCNTYKFCERREWYNE